MASPVTADLALAELRFTWAEQRVENRLHFLFTAGGPSVSDLESLATALDGIVLASFLGLMAANVTFREVYTELYDGVDSPTFTLPSGGIGTASGDSMAPQDSFCLSLRTGLSGRSRRGRFYTIGMAETHQTAGVVTSTYRNAWIAALDDVRTELPGAGWELCVASFIVNGTPRFTGQITPVTAIIAVDDFVDSQDRRKQGRGT